MIVKIGTKIHVRVNLLIEVWRTLIESILAFPDVTVSTGVKRCSNFEENYNCPILSVSR